MLTHLDLGAQAESLVAHSLEQQGFKIIERNYKKPCGEIDLIALNADFIVFVEVKMRSNYYFDLDQLITPSKQRKIMNTASIYLAANNYHDKSCRFDVALVEIENNQPRITYLSDAFSEM